VSHEGKVDRTMSAKLCHRCHKNAPCKGERFCGWCRKAILREMRQSSYLQPVERDYEAEAESVAGLETLRTDL
jgi:hypothetical protein